MTDSTPRPDGHGGDGAGAPSPAMDQLQRDAEWLATLYPVRHAPEPAPWHPTRIHIPASIRMLADGMPGT